jgi:hypothetical protein
MNSNGRVQLSEPVKSDASAKPKGK